MKSFEYALPQNIEDIFQYIDDPNSQIKAGGVDLVDLMKEDLVEPRRLINIRSIKELDYIRDDGDKGIVIGPNRTLAQLAKEKLLQGNLQALTQAAGLAALPQIRNMATLGGNLCQRPRCWYFRSHNFPCARKGGDTCFALDGENQYHAILGNEDGCAIIHPSATAVPLTAMDAELKIYDGKKTRFEKLSNFYITPAQDITRETNLKKNELITEIIIPAAMKNYVTYYIKQREKQSFDWPIADVAVALRLNGGKCSDARIVLGSAAPIPWLARQSQNVLKDQKITKKIARAAADASMEEATPLSENAYKVPVFKSIVYRTICRAAGLDPMN
jgi:xanthine dehydrogenase YagS FAD-binding subunit